MQAEICMTFFIGDAFNLPVNSLPCQVVSVYRNLAGYLLILQAFGQYRDPEFMFSVYMN